MAGRGRLPAEPRQARMRPGPARPPRDIHGGRRPRQAHTGDNEFSPRRVPAPSGNQPVQCSRSRAACRAFSVDDKVTHDKHGLGTVTDVEDGSAVLIDFGSHVLRILTPCSKLTKL